MIQPSTIRWNVTNHLNQAGSLSRPPSACSAIRPAPWNAPQITNGHAAPCQSPPSSIVSHQVAVREQAAAPVAAERDVDEVAQEARERHVPAPPEVAEAGRAVGAAEVLREDVAHQQREADRHVGVAREVAVDLRRVGVGGQRDVRARVRLRDGEHGVDDRAREVVGDHDLLHEAEADQRDPRADGDLARVARLGELRQELARPHDRPRDEVREEAQVDRDVDRAATAPPAAASRRRRTRSPGT